MCVCFYSALTHGSGLAWKMNFSFCLPVVINYTDIALAQSEQKGGC